MYQSKDSAETSSPMQEFGKNKSSAQKAAQGPRYNIPKHIAVSVPNSKDAGVEIVQ